MTGLHTGHAWIRGNGEIPLREEDVTVAMLLRDAGYRTAVDRQVGPRHARDDRAAGQEGIRLRLRLPRSSARAPAVHRSPVSQRASGCRPTSPRDYVNDLFTREAEAFIARPDPKPFFLYLNYTVPHAELRVPEDVAWRRTGDGFPRTPFANAEADARPAGATIDGRSLGYRSQPAPRAAFAAMITRMDRDIGRLTDAASASAGSTSARSSCSSATTARTAKAAPIRSSSRAPAGCAGSSATCTRAASACR